MAVEQRDEVTPILADLVSTTLKRWVEAGRSELSRAARSSKQRLEIRQLRRDRDRFWIRLGKNAYRLTEGGEIDHPALRKAMARIDDLQARIEELVAEDDGADAGGPHER